MQQSPDPAYKSHRHLPRLISDKEIAAIELHHKLLEKKQEIILPENVIKKRILKNGFYIPSNEHLYLHSILSHQTNDYAFLKWETSLKSLYDCIVIIENNENISKKKFKENKYVRRFWLIASLYFQDIDFTPNWIEKKKIKLHKWIKKNPLINKVYQSILFLYHRKNTFFIRIWYFMFNKAYRGYVLRPNGKN